LKTVVAELNVLKKEREEKKSPKQARQNQKRLPKCEPMTHDIYKELIRAAEGPTYFSVRLRIAFCILAVTGIRINELYYL
jgi:integrase